MPTFATWSIEPLGPYLGVSGGGLAISSLAPSLSIERTARSTIAARMVPGAASSVEMVFVGEGALQALVGITASSALDASLGSAAQLMSIGWRVDTGELRRGGVTVVTGLPVVGKQDPIGMTLRTADRVLELYVGRSLVYTYALDGADAAQSWFFATSLGSGTAGDLTCVVNTGQGAAATAALLAGGWQLEDVPGSVLRLGSEDWLAAPGDPAPHARYEGLLTDAGIDLVSEVVFWPWGDATAKTSAGNVPVSDPLGRLDTVTESGSPAVVLRRTRSDGTVATAQPLGRFTLDKVTVSGDADRQLQLRDSLDVIDEPLARAQYLPDAGDSLAWTPQPIVIGAVRNVPLAAVNSDGSLQWVADAPCTVVGLRERGKPLYRQQDWQADTSGQALRMFSPPSSTLYADVSGCGTPADDLWMGGTPFDGTLGVARSAIASGGMVRYRFTVVGLSAGRILLSLTPDPASAVLAVDADGTYEGVVANVGSDAATFAFIATDGSGQISDIRLQVLEEDAAQPTPSGLALTLREIFRRAQFGAWSLDDAEAIDRSSLYAGIGLYAGNASVTARELLRQALPSYAAAEWQDANGVLRVAQLVDPALREATFALTEDDVTQELSVQPDLAPGLTARMGYRPNAAVMAADDFVTDTVSVPAWRRQELASETQGTVWSGVLVAARYAGAQAMAPMISRFDLREDAQAEIDRVCSVYRQERNFYVVRLDAYLGADFLPGQFGTLTYARYGLTALPVMIRRVSRNPVTGATELMMWG